MVLSGPLPDGYEIVAPDDEALTPENVRVRAPDGEILTLEELVLAGVLPA